MGKCEDVHILLCLNKKGRCGCSVLYHCIVVSREFKCEKWVKSEFKTLHMEKFVI